MSAPSSWALERALAIVGLPTYALERTALALDAARRDGAERMREAAAREVEADPFAHHQSHIRALDPARVLAGEDGHE